MTTTAYPSYVAGNDLLTGEVVFLAPDGTWIGHLSGAELVADPGMAEARLRRAQRDADRVVGAGLVEARPGPEGPVPVHVRERIRATGPSNYRHGKQERRRDV